MKKKESRKRQRSLRVKVLLPLALALFWANPKAMGAYTEWTEGYHQMVPGEVYGESIIRNDVRLDIYGGEIAYVWAYNETITNWYDGQMGYFAAHDAAVLNIHKGGLSQFLAALGTAKINLYAYDVGYIETGGHYGYGQIWGTYFSDDSAFCFDLGNQETYAHISVVPEPATFMLVGISGLLLRVKK